MLNRQSFVFLYYAIIEFYFIRCPVVWDNITDKLENNYKRSKIKRLAYLRKNL